MFFAGCVVACGLVVLKPILGLGVIGTVLGICIVTYLIAGTLSGKGEPAILIWALIFPLGYYFLSFPREKSVITLDRVVLLVLLLAIAVASPSSREKLPRDIRSCARAWSAFLIVAGLSCVWGGDFVTSGKLFFDGFCLPALLGWCVLRSFDVRRYAAPLHIVVSAMAVYTMSIGLAEDLLKEDLLPLPGSAIFFAGSVPRPNGPFYSFDSFAVIGVVTFFLLQFLRGAMGSVPIPLWHTLLHRVGILASLAIALMPMFRAVAIAFMVTLLLETWSTANLRRKIAGFTLIGVCAVAVLLISVMAPEVFEDRAQADNIYSRMAQQRQNLQVFLDHPFLGVGLGRFSATVKGETHYLASYQGTGAPDSPHNNLAQIGTETGLLGLVPFIVAQIYLVISFAQASKRRSKDSQLVWKSFLYLFLSYIIIGMSASSVVEPDISIWYIFTISVFYKYYMTEGTLPHFADKQGLPHREYDYVPA
jgi:hypothetical protein